MRILQISTYDTRGGASVAAYRLHRALLGLGADCRMLVRKKYSDRDTVAAVTPPRRADCPREAFFQGHVIQKTYIEQNRTQLSNSLFTFPYPGHHAARMASLHRADVINLHWVARFMSPTNIQTLLKTRKPVVWTLHDQWAFTGGCHYSAGCEGFQGDCGQCPQIADDPFGMPAAVLRDKVQLFARGDLALVSPSRWLATCAARSTLFRETPVYVIPNGLDTDVFRPVHKESARGALGLPPEAFTILFVAEHVAEKRKGFQQLKAAIVRCLESESFRRLAKQGKVRLLCLGHPDPETADLPVPVICPGYLGSEEEMCMAYNAADLFVQPSLEDNLPNTMLEAMSCGIPVIAFRAGGMPEVVESGATGYLVSPGDGVAMGEAILSLLAHGDQAAHMGKTCRKKVEREYAVGIQASRYVDLFETLCRKGPPKSQGPPRPEKRSPWLDADPEAGLDTRLGPATRQVYDKILLHSMKTFAYDLYKKHRALAAEKPSWLQQIESLTRDLGSCERHAQGLDRQLKTITRQLRQCEEDRRRRETQIEILNGHLAEARKLADRQEAHLKSELEQWTTKLNSLTAQLEASEKDRRARGNQIDTLSEQLQEAARKGEDHIRQIQHLSEMLTRSEEERRRQAEQVEQLEPRLEASERNLRALMDQLERVSAFLKEANDDREERLGQIVRLTDQLRQAGEYQERLQADVSLMKARIEVMREQRKALEEALVEQERVLRAPLVRFFQSVHLIERVPDSWQTLLETCRDKKPPSSG